MNPTRIRFGAVVALALATMSPAPASAHTAGKVQLWLDRIALHSDGGRDWTVSVELIDADSGTPEPGFDVTVEGNDDGGHSLAPVALTDAGRGRYTGRLAVDPGKWSLTVRAQSRPGGEAAIPLQKAQALVLQPGKDVAIGSASPAATGSGAAAGPALNVKIERADRAGRTPLWLPVRVTVTEGDAGAPPSADHVVFAAARNARGDEAGPFELGTLELEGQRGVHEGFVIVSYGGTWTIDVAVNDARSEPGAADALLGRGTADLVVDAPVPPAGTAAAASGDSPQGEPIGVAVLWVHTMLAILWGIAVALLALLAVPAGRRFLSEYGTNLLDGRMDKIARAAWWLTGLVIVTGIYNLVESVAYRVPLSPDQATRLFRLPYAEPYYLALAVKLAAYAVMIGVTIPLIREARRRAATAEAGAGPAATVVLDDDPSPWENPQRPSAGDEGAGGRVALRRRMSAEVAVEDTWALDDRAGRPAARLVALLAGGGAVIITAVTLLKYFHLMSEVSRLAG